VTIRGEECQTAFGSRRRHCIECVPFRFRRDRASLVHRQVASEERPKHGKGGIAGTSDVPLLRRHTIPRVIELIAERVIPEDVLDSDAEV